MICCLNGKFIDEKKAKISILDNGFMFGDAFFDTMISRNGIIMELENHLQRIEKTAKTLHVKLPPKKQLEDWLKKTIKINKLKNARLRMTISRGANGRDFFTSKKPTIAITCDRFIVNENFENGIAILTLNFQRPWPEIKSTNLITMIRAYYRTFPKKVHEAILIDDLDYVTEGCTSNIFMIKNSKIFTPKDKILPGVTRNRMIQLCIKNKIKIHTKNFKKGELLKADEIFLTNSTNGVVPVVKIDNKKVGLGKVGSYTKKIITIYKNSINL